jgi:hypothetical protein
LSAVRDCLFIIFAATLHIWRPFLHPQSEDAPCRGDRDPLITDISKNANIKRCRNIILSFVLYGSEILPLPLREGRRLRLFDIRVLRRIYGPKTDEVMGHGRRLHNDELYDVYFSPNIITVAARGAHISEKRNTEW